MKHLLCTRHQVKCWEYTDEGNNVCIPAEEKQVFFQKLQMETIFITIKTADGEVERRAQKKYLEIWGKVLNHLTGIYKQLLYSSGEGNGTPLQYSCLENPMGGGAW